MATKAVTYLLSLTAWCLAFPKCFTKVFQEPMCWVWHHPTFCSKTRPGESLPPEGHHTEGQHGLVFSPGLIVHGSTQSFSSSSLIMPRVTLKTQDHITWKEGSALVHGRGPLLLAKANTELGISMKVNVSTARFENGYTSSDPSWED